MIVYVLCMHRFSLMSKTPSSWRRFKRLKSFRGPSFKQGRCPSYFKDLHVFGGLLIFESLMVKCFLMLWSPQNRHHAYSDTTILNFIFLHLMQVIHPRTSWHPEKGWIQIQTFAKLIVHRHIWRKYVARLPPPSSTVDKCRWP